MAVRLGQSLTFPVDLCTCAMQTVPGAQNKNQACRLHRDACKLLWAVAQAFRSAVAGQKSLLVAQNTIQNTTRHFGRNRRRDGQKQIHASSWRMGRAPKDPTVDSVKRPTLELSAVILHGHGTYLYITEESTRLGSNWAAEIVMRSVNAAWLRCQRLGSDGLMSSAYTPTTLCPRSKTQSSVG